MTDLAVLPAPVVLRHDLTGDLAAALHAVPRVAWDIETSGLDWRTDRIGTCQLHAPDVGTIIVQLNGHQPSLLPELLADPGVLKAFHHAPFDLRFMTWHWRTPAVSIACTKVASKLLTPHEANDSHSLQALLDRYLGVKISKAERISDWLADDLSEGQLRYAAADVTHLLPLLSSLEKELANAGLTGLYAQCIEFLPTRVQLEVDDYPDVFAY
ncbi:MAG: ribonuclease D [Mycobacteriales bacterium]